MTSVIPTPNLPAPVVAEIPAAAQTLEVSEGRHCTRKGCVIEDGSGRVPSFEDLYHELRGTQVQKSRPLTRSEVLSRELCSSCARLASFPTFSTAGTLDTMARWAEQNAERAQRAYEARQRERQFEAALRRENSGINAILAEGPRKPRHHKKLSRRQQREQAALKHRAPKPEEGKKGKKNKDKQGGKQKGGKGKKK